MSQTLPVICCTSSFVSEQIARKKFEVITSAHSDDATYDAAIICTLTNIREQMRLDPLKPLPRRMMIALSAQRKIISSKPILQPVA